MAAIPSHLPVIIQLYIRFLHFSFDLYQNSSLELGSGHCYTSCNFSISIILSIPWECGKPRRGPT